MNIILSEPEEVQNETVLLTDHRAKHIVKVLGSKEGDVIKFGVLDGMRGKATILSMHKRFPFRVELQVNLNIPPSVKPPIDLLLALPRPIMLKRIFSQAAALGVGSLYITNANRVEKSFWEASLLEPSSYREHLVHGLEQAVDTRLPHVEFHRRFRPFIEDYIPKKLNEYSHVLLAHPHSQKLLHEVVTQKMERVLLAVGPEGGWVDFEVEKFMSINFHPFTMGERILKVDTAVISLHGRLSALSDSSS